MRIQHNIPAMSAYRYYTNNTSALAKNLEKLSSGYKINRAGDDAAGLAISEKMRAQITGLEVAQKNAKDGISLVQTAEGALTEVHDMLNRMYSLAEQSANGTYDNDVDRKQLQKEIESLSTEINRISESANFNGIKLLNGDQGAKSLSALGEAATVVDGSAIDGTNPSAAGAAEITVDLRSSAAVNGEVLKSDTDNDVDGSDLAPATKAEFTITVGGVKGDSAATAKLTVTGKIDVAGGNNTDVNGDTVDMTKWDAGSYIEFTAADGQTYKFSHGEKDGYVDVGANLDAELTKAGFTMANPAANNASITVTKAGDITGFHGTDKIESGVTTYAGLKDLKIDANTKLSDLFDIKVNGTTVDAQTDKILNGDKITLVAKKAGELPAASFSALESLTSTEPTGANTNTLKAQVEATNGKDVDYAAPAVTPTKYDISIDIAKLQGGQEIRIGTNKIKFVMDGTEDLSGTAGTGDEAAFTKIYTINLSKADGTGQTAGSTEGIAGDLETVLGKIFDANAKFDTAKTTWTSSGSKYTYHAESLTANAGDITAANMGAVRVFEANVDGETDITDANKAISSTYAPSKEPAAGADNNPFAQVEYTIDKDKIAAGNTLTIGGKEIKIVAGGTADPEDLAAGKVAIGANFAANLVKALEQQGYTTGKVTANGGNNADLTLKIEGTKVGESAAELKADAGKVTFLDKSKAGPNVVQVGTSDMKIEVGKTKVSDLLEKEMVAATGGAAAKTLGDLFRITDANGRELKADTVIADGQTIKFVAKDKGKLDSSIIDKLKFDSGEANITFKNGWDEGTAASGDKTHYELQFNLNNLRGGQTFTFGTDSSSVTFELTFDNDTTKNGTVNDEDNTDLDGTTNGTRVKINLKGLTTDAEKIKAIVDQVTNTMDKFDVSYSATAGKMTLMMDGRTEWNASTNDTNLGNVRVSSNNSALGSTVYNPAGGAAAGTPGTYAQIAYKFDVSKLQEGDSLTVGDTTIYIGKESKVEKDGSGSKITVSLEDAKGDTNLLTQALESAGYRGGKVEFSDGKVTITGVETGETADHLKGNLGKIVLGTTTNRAMSEGGLKLQIGDTADPYNQMVVDIKSCTTSAMGLDGLDISSQANAIDSMAKIKDAINYVSDIRGGLGATQNRLDHTINNLSVMRENIQDAESTIRDVDVAEEMMAYTKNNILVQSAQAMLAQANQLPQGVLQLLQ